MKTQEQIEKFLKKSKNSLNTKSVLNALMLPLTFPFMILTTVASSVFSFFVLIACAGVGLVETVQYAEGLADAMPEAAEAFGNVFNFGKGLFINPFVKNIANNRQLVKNIKELLKNDKITEKQYFDCLKQLNPKKYEKEVIERKEQRDAEKEQSIAEREQVIAEKNKENSSIIEVREDIIEEQTKVNKPVKKSKSQKVEVVDNEEETF